MTVAQKNDYLETISFWKSEKDSNKDIKVTNILNGKIYYENINGDDPTSKSLVIFLREFKPII